MTVRITDTTGTTGTTAPAAVDRHLVRRLLRPAVRAGLVDLAPIRRLLETQGRMVSGLPLAELGERARDTSGPNGAGPAAAMPLVYAEHAAAFPSGPTRESPSSPAVRAVPASTGTGPGQRPPDRSGAPPGSVPRAAGAASLVPAVQLKATRGPATPLRAVPPAPPRALAAATEALPLAEPPPRADPGRALLPRGPEEPVRPGPAIPPGDPSTGPAAAATGTRPAVPAIARPLPSPDAAAGVPPLRPVDDALPAVLLTLPSAPPVALPRAAAARSATASVPDGTTGEQSLKRVSAEPPPAASHDSAVTGRPVMAAVPQGAPASVPAPVVLVRTSPAATTGWALSARQPLPLATAVPAAGAAGRSAGGPAGYAGTSAYPTGQAAGTPPVTASPADRAGTPGQSAARVAPRPVPEPKLDMDELTGNVQRRLVRRFAVEAERRRVR